MVSRGLVFQCPNTYLRIRKQTQFVHFGMVPNLHIFKLPVLLLFKSYWQAWKKCLFHCKLGKISLQQGRFPSCISLSFPSKSQNFLARSFPFCHFFFLFFFFLFFVVSPELSSGRDLVIQMCVRRVPSAVRCPWFFVRSISREPYGLP